MSILDDRGRLLGRINLIDAVVVAIICWLIPMAYAAYLLFRTPPARITAIEPARSPLGLRQITVRGENLRPYLKVTVGSHDLQLLYENPSVGVVPLQTMEAGSYDVILYDEEQELQRLPGALVIEAPKPLPRPGALVIEAPSGEFTVSGAFAGLDAENAAAVAKALKTAPHEYSWGRVIGFLPPEEDATWTGTYRVRAVIRLSCSKMLPDCVVGGVAVGWNTHLALILSEREPSRTFRIDELYPARMANVQVTVRAGVFRELSNVIASEVSARKRDFPALDDLQPSVLSLRYEDRTLDGYDTITVVVRVPAERTGDSWRYRGQLLRIGAGFTVGKGRFEFAGTIVDLQPQVPQE
jgi:hypothetical protein